jgi:Flp pilus assembly protein TadD
MGLLWTIEVRKRNSGRVAGLLLPACAAVVVALPWGVRDWLWTGNPVYPLAPRWFPATGWNPYVTPVQASSLVPAGAGRSALDLATGLVRFPFDVSWRITGIGATFSPLLFGLLPGLLIPPRPRREMWLLLAAGLAGCVCWVLSPVPDGRYLLPSAALLAVPATVGALRIAGRGRGWRVATGAVVAGMVGCQLAAWLGFVSATYVPWRVAAGLERRDVYLGRALLPNHEFFPMAAALNARLPPRARILMFSDITSYYIEREVVFDTQQVMPPVALRLAGACTEPAALRRRFRQLGLDYVLYSSGRLAAFQHDCHCLDLPPGPRACFGAFWRRYATRQFQLGSLTLYRLKGEREAGEIAARPEPFVAWPGIQEAMLADVEAARARGDEPGQRDAIRRLAALAPDLAEVPLRLADVDTRARRFGDAARDLAAARRLGADSGPYWMLSAVVRSMAHDRVGALAAAREGVARWPVPQAWAALAEHAFVAGELPEARRALAEARRLAPHDPEVRRAAALLP